MTSGSRPLALDCAALGCGLPAEQLPLDEVRVLSQLVDAVAPLLEEHPPLRALTCWLQRLVEYARVKRGVMAAIEASAWRDIYSNQHHRLDEALGILLDRGKAAGQVREEIDSADVILCWVRCRGYRNRNGTDGCTPS